MHLGADKVASSTGKIGFSRVSKFLKRGVGFLECVIHMKFYLYALVNKKMKAIKFRINKSEILLYDIQY